MVKSNFQSKELPWGAVPMDAAELPKNAEQYVYFQDRHTATEQCRLEYRDKDGELFATIRTSLLRCRETRDAWLMKKYGFESEYTVNAHLGLTIIEGGRSADTI
jgi:hypothetical protein